MVCKSFQTDALNKLCFRNQLNLLNSVNSLCSQDISHYVSLPQIIVCSNQLSEKSSVLKAISGVSFSIKSNLSTWFLTELVFHKISQINVNISIIPHQVCIKSEQLTLSSFHKKLKDFKKLPNLIENTKTTMRISTHNKAFLKNLFWVEVLNSNQFHLTIVNLSEFIHSETKQQTASDIEFI